MRDREPGREGAGLFQIEGETEHHATVHIDDDGQRRSLDRLPVLFVNHNDIHGSMVNLGDRERSIGAGEVALDRFVFLRRGFLALALLQFQAIRKQGNPASDGAGVGLLELGFEALQLDLFNDRCDVGLFSGEVDLQANARTRSTLPLSTRSLSQ